MPSILKAFGRSSGAWMTWTEPSLPLVDSRYTSFAKLASLTVKGLSLKASAGIVKKKKKLVQTRMKIPWKKCYAEN